MTSSHGRNQMIYFNNGSAVFNQHFLLEASVNSIDASFADLNNDSYPDVVVAVDDASSRFYINNKDGTFTGQDAPASLMATDVEVTDIDNDGDTDIAFIVGSTVEVYLNDGVTNTVSFTQTATSPSIGATGCIVKFFDARDANNELDLIVGCEASLMYFTYTSGDYATAAVAISTTRQINALTDADMDADGKQDILIVGDHHWNAASKPGIMFGNDDADRFTDAYDFSSGTNYISAPNVDDSNGSIAVADFDKDGDLDIFAAGKGAGPVPVFMYLEN